MKNLVSATAIGALAVALLPLSALAADLPSSTKDGGSHYATESGGVVNWSGFYIGGAVGYGNSNHDLTVQNYNGAYCFDGYGSEAAQPEDPTFPIGWNVRNVPEGGCGGEDETDEVLVDPSSKGVANLNGLNSSGFVGDVRAGFDIAQGRYLFGVFGSYGIADMNTEASIDGLGNAWIEKQDEWNVGARVGVIVAPKTLAYILAAYTQTQYEFGVSDGTDSASKDVTFDGVTVGGGIEFAVTSNIFVGLEATHTFYGEETIFDTGASEVGGFGSRIVDDLDETKVLLTMKAKLNTGLFGN